MVFLRVSSITNSQGFTKLIEVACGPQGLSEGSLEGRAVLLTEPNYMDRKLRDAYAEMLFEDLKVCREKRERKEGKNQRAETGKR